MTKLHNSSYFCENDAFSSLVSLVKCNEIKCYFFNVLLGI